MNCNPSSVRVGETFGELVPNVTGAHGLGYARKKIGLVINALHGRKNGKK